MCELIEDCRLGQVVQSSGTSSSSCQIQLHRKLHRASRTSLRPQQTQVGCIVQIGIGSPELRAVQDIESFKPHVHCAPMLLETVNVLAIDTFSLYSGKLRIFGLVLVTLPTWSCGCNGKKPLLVMVAVAAANVP